MIFLKELKKWLAVKKYKVLQFLKKLKKLIVPFYEGYTKYFQIINQTELLLLNSFFSKPNHNRLFRRIV